MSQYRAIEVLLSWQTLAGAIRMPLAEFAKGLGLRVERSSNDSSSCEFAYLETDQDAFTLATWESSNDVEVWATVAAAYHGTADFPVGAAEFGRFMTLADTAPDDVLIPPGFRPQTSPQ
jgi:hypothetical protein